MPLAARITDKTSHPGVLSGPGVASVLIGNKPAGVAGDSHACAFSGTPPHPPSVFAKGSASVLIGGRGALRVGDTAGCGASLIEGAPDVQIGG
jgi:uncharacterized Zn-binding protein involved in type VI secretion